MTDLATTLAPERTAPVPVGPRERSTAGRRILVGVLAVLLLAALWELVKVVVPDAGGYIGEASVLPRTDDLAMPHVWDVVDRVLQPETSATGSPTVLSAMLSACWFTLRVALAGWLVGSIGGLLLAALMQRWQLAESALVPWVVLSQTVPLIALAPLVVGWGGRIHIGTFEWQRWMSVALIASYLAFFPVTIGALRGFQSPPAAQVELFRAQAASWNRTMLSLRLPASVPYLLPALRLGAATAVVGAIVAEVSTGTKGGIGRLIISYAQSASGDPAKPWAAIIAAALLGLVAAALVSLLGLGLGRYRYAEVR
ncbi:ABC transporter permease [Cellulomonas humilata]|uniref:NitT/TauT family transport system permease protein n=1 Tax=Cellulomonas humilata TaxID=144055 RepID=A0ABU0EG97_9CELL|nr:ABC transporter permease subunit [Cellulomonas humilata]MDQ0374259.1 NitT/TauT family transport system permease protein [Cellulomonas humilata]